MAKEQSLSSIYKIEGKKSFLANSTTPVQVEDGVNEDGLAVGLTFLFPTVRKPGLNAGLLVRYLLEHCSSVPEAIAALGALPISSMQTLTMADRQGRMAVVECNCEAMEVRYPEQGERFVAATNHFCAERLLPYQTTMPDTIHSHKRLETLEQALRGKDRYSRTFLQELLAGKHGFLCQYEPGRGWTPSGRRSTACAPGRHFSALTIRRRHLSTRANVFSFDPLDKFYHPVL